MTQEDGACATSRREMALHQLQTRRHGVERIPNLVNQINESRGAGRGRLRCLTSGWAWFRNDFQLRTLRFGAHEIILCANSAKTLFSDAFQRSKAVKRRFYRSDAADSQWRL